MWEKDKNTDFDLTFKPVASSHAYRHTGHEKKLCPGGVATAPGTPHLSPTDPGGSVEAAMGSVGGDGCRWWYFWGTREDPPLATGGAARYLWRLEYVRPPGGSEEEWLRAGRGLRTSNYWYSVEWRGLKQWWPQHISLLGEKPTRSRNKELSGEIIRRCGH